MHRPIAGALALALGLGGCDRDQARPGPAPDATADAPLPSGLTTAPALAEAAPGIDAELLPLATAGDRMPGSGEVLLPAPDGIGLFGEPRRLSLMVNHELHGLGGYSAHVSRLVIDPADPAILDHTYVVDGSAGYEHLCSAEWVDARDGFPGGYFFTGEETVNGLQLAIDEQGRVTELPHLGRYDHENQIAVPGFRGHVVVLNFDDNGGQGTGRAASRSELYMYVARNSREVLSGAGQLYAFRADEADPTPGDLSVGDAVPGHWVPVPDEVALDAGRLQQWVHDHRVFPFVRLEDGFYDKRPGAGPAAYFYDTGRGTIVDEAGDPWDPWGSIYRLEFGDPADPAGPATLRLLARSTAGQGDEAVDEGDMWASPDNGDMTADGVIMLQEDPANGTWSRAPSVWRLHVAADGSLVDPAGTRVIQVRDPDCPGPDCSDITAWETSGIVDASEWFGPDAWIFDVQAHTKATFEAPGHGFVETGQLLLARIR